MDQKDPVLQQFLSLRKSHPEQGLRLLMDQYGEAMYGVTSKILHNADAAEDSLQEGFIKIWRNLNEYNPERSSLFTWILTIIRNTAIDNLRKHGTRKIQSIDSDVYNDIKLSESMQITDPALMNKINTLDPKYRALIDLVYLQGYTQQEIADEFGIPLGTVKTRISTAIKMLRNILIKLVLIYFYQ
ncbi:MAG: RNA polymerase sigma factor [Saprospiraceae bacterium]|nr:RNA polymerase sigma factor [Saprospiraceae bacterium]HMW40229.1 RNA polymerase sigma factor [Saprospiraceae bacterium]HMX89276.1 RNA polymerase sigma factor [Saprospiraceae bacterium]HMZ40620.1 RNA polymerase sigma factor [Saprospiraceae bacterium]HNA63696.1 RNA polymerase sigma factor [Saprospiraceae bacterium]